MACSPIANCFGASIQSANANAIIAKVGLNYRF
jgi:hypothetical protein